MIRRNNKSKKLQQPGAKRRKMEKMLQKQQEEQQIILDSVPAWIFYKDKENRFIRVNKVFAEVMEMPKEQLEGKSMFDLYPKEQAEAYWRDDCRKQNDSGKAFAGKFEDSQFTGKPEI